MSDGVLFLYSSNDDSRDAQQVVPKTKIPTQCLHYKATAFMPQGVLHTPMPSQRFEILALELFGPLPETDVGYRLQMNLCY